MNLAEKTLSSEYVYQGRMINLRVDQVELPDGKSAQREIVEHPGAVAVVALTNNRELVMVRQYRKPIDKVILEIPAGKLNHNEDPEICAQRELLEETGYQAGQLSLIARYYTTPGFSDEVMYLYLARKLIELEQSPDEDEFIEMTRVPLATAQQMVLTGEIQDAKTIIGILALNSF
ncbi:MAG: NUDIX domain-containing protein [Bacillota bacterium]